MITRTLELPEKTERQIQLASAAFRLSGTDFIMAAVTAALETAAEEVPDIERAFKLVD